MQIPPSTTYVMPPLKRPIEEDGEDKSPSKKKKKIQKKGTWFLWSGGVIMYIGTVSIQSEKYYFFF